MEERSWRGINAAVSPLWAHCPAQDGHSAVCDGPLCAESSMCDWTTWSQRGSIIRSSPTHTLIQALKSFCHWSVTCPTLNGQSLITASCAIKRTHLLLVGPEASTSACSLGKNPCWYFPWPIFISSRWGWMAVWSIFLSRCSMAWAGEENHSSGERG